MTPEQRTKMIAGTRDAAIAFIEDLDHLNTVLAHAAPSAADIRRTSAILRRLLVEDDLRAVAAPRNGKISIVSQDNNPIYRAERAELFAFVATAGASIFGVYLSTIMIKRASVARVIPGFHPDNKVDLRLDTFLTQRIICVNGEWASRRDVIKYMANVASGVHSGSPQTAEERLLAQARLCGSTRLEGEVPTFSMNPLALEGDLSPQPYNPNSIDPVLMEVFATAHFLATSPDVVQLTQIIRTEISKP